MRSILICGILLLFAVPSLSQRIPAGHDAEENIRDLLSTRSFGNVRTYDLRYEGVKGFPTAYESWRKGIVVLEDSGVIRDISMNYDSYQNQLLYYDPRTDEAMLIDPGRILYALIESHVPEQFYMLKEKTIRLPGETREKNRMVHVIYEGESFELMHVWFKQLIKADYKGPYSANRRFDEFRDAGFFYLAMKDGGGQKFSPKKKNLLKLFRDEQERMNIFLHENRFNYEDPQDLAKIFSHYELLKK